MIQRIAEEAKLTDLDINAEERVSPKTTFTNEKGMNILIVFSIIIPRSWHNTYSVTYSNFFFLRIISYDPQIAKSTEFEHIYIPRSKDHRSEKTHPFKKIPTLVTKYSQ